MKHQIDVPLVQQDLSHEETIVQISLSLEKLSQVVTALFDNVNVNIQRQNAQLADIQTRCAASRRKLEKLTGLEKSVKVFSSSKFPGPTPRTFYPLPVFKIDGHVRNVRIPLTPLPEEKLSLKQKSKFYHIKDSTWLLRKNEGITPSEGLGDLPCLKAVNNLLLFNTKQNLYSQYKILDPLSAHKNVVIVEESRTQSPIGPAPMSLASESDTARQLANLQGYLYSPSAQDVPDINAPLNLPNLTNIAGDLRFDEIDEQVPRRKSSAEKLPPKDTAKADDVSSISREDMVPRDEIVLAVENFTPVPPAPAQPAAPPPPPPPPPPPADLAAVDHPNSDIPKKNPKAKKDLPLAADSRADLMAAIRNAGGSGKAKLRPVSEPTDLAPSKPGKPGNFMEDLHAKLSMRRKGISGKIDPSEAHGRPVGMLDRINQMIPPPPPKGADTPNDELSDWEE